MPQPAAAARQPFDLQGHRGARGLFPENALPGFAAAIALGVTSIELDVVLTADGIPVVFHDLALNPDIVRGANGQWLSKPAPLIANLLAVDLSTFDIGRLRPNSAYARRFANQTAIDGTRIPTLAAVCALAVNTPVRLDIEIKTSPADATNPAALNATASAILDVLQRVDGHLSVSCRSFNWLMLRHLRQQGPNLPLAWLTTMASRATAAQIAAEINRDGWPSWQPAWAPDHRLLRRTDITQAHALGLLIKPWTVNTPSTMRRLLAWHVDGLCTDRPDLMLPILAARSSA